MTQKKWRLIVGSLLFALMLFELCVRSYFFYFHIPSVDGWKSGRDSRTHNLIIKEIDPNGPATKLRTGDEFIAINNITFEQDPTILNYCLRVPPDTSYTLTVRRENQELTFYLKTVAGKSRYFPFAIKALVFVDLLFLITGFTVLLLKPENKQAWLLSVSLCLFSGMPHWNFPYAMFGSWVEYLVHFSKVIGFWFIIYFAKLFLWFPEKSILLKRYTRLEKYLQIPFYILIVPGVIATRFPPRLSNFTRSNPVTKWFTSQDWFNLVTTGTLVFYILMILFFMFVSYRSSNKYDRNRLRIIITGGSLAAIASIVNIIAESSEIVRTWPFLYKWINAADVFAATLIPITFAYAIVRHKVIPVSLIIRQGVRYFLVSRGAAAVVIAVICLGIYFLIDGLYAYLSFINVRWISALTCIIAIIAWNSAFKFYQRRISPVIDRKFFRESYNATLLLSELQYSIEVVKDKQKLMTSVGNTVQTALHSEYVFFYVRDENSGGYKSFLSQNTGLKSNSNVDNGFISLDPELVKSMMNSHEAIEVNNNFKQYSSNNGLNKEFNYGIHDSASKKINDQENSLAVPITSQNTVAAIMFMGPRLGDLTYSKEDRQVVKSIARQMSTAFENINLVERMIDEERARKEIEAQNEIRAKELDDARKLQLSMLPKHLPCISGLEIAAYMKTATEVGGDYYDFHVKEDGTLTVVVGDATGHGLKAGTLVTAMKGLFEVLADKSDINEVLRQSSYALKRMNLKTLFMALTMLKVKGNTVSIGNAGMPPIYIYRSNLNDIETIELYGAPLGAISNYKYKTIDLTVNTGDIILLMSDGLAERFNSDDQMLDYHEIKKTFASCSNQSPQTIIDNLVSLGDSWGGGRPQDDDITFVVVKF